MKKIIYPLLLLLITFLVFSPQKIHATTNTLDTYIVVDRDNDSKFNFSNDPCFKGTANLSINNVDQGEYTNPTNCMKVYSNTPTSLYNLVLKLPSRSINYIKVTDSNGTRTLTDSTTLTSKKVQIKPGNGNSIAIFGLKSNCVKNPPQIAITDPQNHERKGAKGDKRKYILKITNKDIGSDCVPVIFNLSAAKTNFKLEFENNLTSITIPKNSSQTTNFYATPLSTAGEGKKTISIGVKKASATNIQDAVDAYYVVQASISTPTCSANSDCTNTAKPVCINKGTANSKCVACAPGSNGSCDSATQICQNNSCVAKACGSVAGEQCVQSNLSSECVTQVSGKTCSTGQICCRLVAASCAIAPKITLKGTNTTGRVTKYKLLLENTNAKQCHYNFATKDLPVNNWKPKISTPWGTNGSSLSFNDATGIIIKNGPPKQILFSVTRPVTINAPETFDFIAKVIESGSSINYQITNIVPTSTGKPSAKPSPTTTHKPTPVGCNSTKNFGFAVTPGNPKAVAGTEVKYEVKITNKDSGATCAKKTFTITGASISGNSNKTWTTRLSDKKFDIPAGKSKTVSLFVKSPTGAKVGTQKQITVTAKKESNAPKNAFAKYTVKAKATNSPTPITITPITESPSPSPTTCGNKPTMNISQNKTWAKPGGKITYIVRVKNVDASKCKTKNLVLTKDLLKNWKGTWDKDNNFKLPPGSEKKFELTVESPKGTKLGPKNVKIILKGSAGTVIRTKTEIFLVANEAPVTPPVTPPTPGPGVTGLSFILGANGIGTTPRYEGNTDPKNPNRMVTIKMINASNNNAVAGLDGTTPIEFTYSDNKLRKDINLNNSDIPAGVYNVYVSSPQYLNSRYPGSINITNDVMNNLDSENFFLITGNTTDSGNSENKINYLDYILIQNCFSVNAPAKDCNDENKKLADLNDDGNVDLEDITLWRNEVGNQQGVIIP